MNQRDEYFINLLFEIAKNVPRVAGAKISSALVYKNKIISQGQNRYKSHPLQARWGKNEKAIYLHAEIDTLKTAVGLDISDCVLYIARARLVGNAWVHGSARPCNGCMEFLRFLNIKRIVYT